MKKGIIAGICLFGVLCIGGAAALIYTVSNNHTIEKETAQEIAFADAGVEAASVTIIRIEQDFEDGKSVYDVEFTANGTEYEYRINSKDGSIEKKETEPAVQTDSAGGNTPSAQGKTDGQGQADSAQQPAVSDSQITLETAKETALLDAGLTVSGVTFTKEKQDTDDGIIVYDIEFYTGTDEYEYEINAQTGAIHSKKTEKLQTPPEGGTVSESGSGENYIGVDEAKSIAASHAGLAAASDISFSRAKLENDDGYTVYEIEFFQNGMEYDYTIDAYNGTVLEYDSEPEN